MTKNIHTRGGPDREVWLCGFVNEDKVRMQMCAITATAGVQAAAIKFCRPGVNTGQVLEAGKLEWGASRIRIGGGISLWLRCLHVT